MPYCLRSLTDWSGWIIDSASTQPLELVEFANGMRGLVERTLGFLNLRNSVPLAAQGISTWVQIYLIKWKNRIKQNQQFHQVSIQISWSCEQISEPLLVSTSLSSSTTSLPVARANTLNAFLCSLTSTPFFRTWQVKNIKDAHWTSIKPTTKGYMGSKIVH